MEGICFPKLLLPISFLTLKFTQVLENIHKGVQDMDFTGKSTEWQPSAALGNVEKEAEGICTAPKSHEGRWLQMMANSPGCGAQQSPAPEFSCTQNYLGLSPLVVYCQCWVTGPFPLCSISSWISFYVCDALLGSTCLCCFPHFL